MVKSKVFLLKTKDRNYGIGRLMEEFNLSTSNVAIKANYNSADPFPASTHPDTLREIIKNLQERGITDITLAERSGMGKTREVLTKMGVFKLAQELNFNVTVLDEMEREEWVKIEREGTHWLKGFYMPRLFLESSEVIQTCCLKTHRFGGHFTLSLKNSVGMVSKRLPGGIYDYMAELHISPNQRKMIAEINNYYKVDMIVMDAIKAFISKGPERGRIVEPQLLIATSDRVANDAVGVALLRNYGNESELSKKKIFQQSQIKRASELGIGVKIAQDIEVVALNDESELDAQNIINIFEYE